MTWVCECYEKGAQSPGRTYKYRGVLIRRVVPDCNISQMIGTRWTASMQTQYGPTHYHGISLAWVRRNIDRRLAQGAKPA